MTKISSQIRQRAARVKLFLCDVDGVLTDGSIFVGGNPPSQSSGAAGEFKQFNIQDGLGLVLLRRAGFKTGWVSARPSAATELRARELKIDFLIQQTDRLAKTGAIEKILAREKLNWRDVCFIGDDIVDLGPLKRAGFSVAVANGIAEVKTAAHFVTKNAGGRGAVREIAEMILRAQDKWRPFVEFYSE